MCIFDDLRKDHDFQRELANALIHTHTDAGTRMEVFSRLKRELTAHVYAEAEYLHHALLTNDLTREASFGSLSDHRALLMLIDMLEETEYESTRWLAIARTLHHRLHFHLAEEEHQLFSLASHVLDDDKRAEIAMRYRQQMTHGVMSAPVN
ncbi:hypothetical protein [Nitrogeniibacter aestuarii]|uniref:hypothetical protein n=1 Tax=Nitrogeniibacter aestuarii TaxID=2815343 RepID=UPI001D107005|nr:hypothetical protein [Nitrogeniibacter aestuarii]